MTKENKIEFINRLHGKLVDVSSKREDALARWCKTKKDADYDEMMWFDAQRCIIRRLIDDLFTEVRDEIFNTGEQNDE